MVFCVSGGRLLGSTGAMGLNCPDNFLFFACQDQSFSVSNKTNSFLQFLFVGAIQ